MRFIIPAQVLLVIGLFLYIFSKINAKHVYVNRIEKNSVTSNKESTLKYFYEPKPNTPSVTDPSIPWTRAIGLRNKEGLNERFDYKETKDPGVFRIITIGDSYTAGLGVNTEENYTELLEKKLNTEIQCKKIDKFEVINLAVSAYDLEYAVERFRLRGVKYQPDLVIWLFKDDDFYEINEIIKEKEQQIIKDMVESGEWARLTAQGNIYPPNEKLEQIMVKSHVDLGEAAILRRQTENLTRMRAYYKGPLALFTFPSTDRAYRKIASDFAKSSDKTYFFDTITDINKHKETMTFYPYDMHPNKKGHETMAKDILINLIKRKLLNCL